MVAFKLPKNFKTRISAEVWRLSLTRVEVVPGKSNTDMSIAQTNSPVNPSVGAIGDIPLTCFTIEELEALLEAAAHSLRMGQSLKHSLEDCSTHSMFDTEFLVELKFQEQSRDELLGLVGAIAHRLHELEALEVSHV